eukprot:GEMP01142853.1.p1 GENE.GEMP01142853.1~~GEMP01142853.1.p1  ORF type:complete len:101 (+),score=6.43 GEMP01142853.1:133-435(+)
MVPAKNCFSRRHLRCSPHAGISQRDKKLCCDEHYIEFARIVVQKSSHLLSAGVKKTSPKTGNAAFCCFVCSPQFFCPKPASLGFGQLFVFVIDHAMEGMK